MIYVISYGYEHVIHIEKRNSLGWILCLNLIKPQRHHYYLILLIARGRGFTIYKRHLLSFEPQIYYLTIVSYSDCSWILWCTYSKRLMINLWRREHNATNRICLIPRSSSIQVPEVATSSLYIREDKSVYYLNATTLYLEVALSYKLKMVLSYSENHR